LNIICRLSKNALSLRPEPSILNLLYFFVFLVKGYLGLFLMRVVLNMKSDHPHLRLKMDGYRMGGMMQVLKLNKR